VREREREKRTDGVEKERKGAGERSGGGGTIAAVPPYFSNAIYAVATLAQGFLFSQQSFVFLLLD
jgi:hypothetical protein